MKALLCMNGKKQLSAFLIQEIVENANQIKDRIRQFGITHESFSQSTLYQDMLAMPLLRICELVSEYKEDFEKIDSSYPWTDVAKMRSKMAHPYGGFDFEFVWFAIQDDLDVLVETCQRAL